MKKTITKTEAFVPDGKTKVSFLFGSNVNHSLSPTLYSTWFQKYGLNCVYLPLEINGDKKFVTLLKGLTFLNGFLGANITNPFKNTALKINTINQSETVKTIQAANIIYKNATGQWFFENTDIYGIEASIYKLIEQNEKFDLIVLGGGGASAITLYWGILNKNCFKINCFTRNPNKTLKKYYYLKGKEKLSIDHLNIENINLFLKNIEYSTRKTILINTLPLGLNSTNTSGSYKEPNFFATEIIKNLNRNSCSYFDLIYDNTKAIEIANDKGIKNINGKLMLMTQAKKNFLLWTGIEIMN